MSCKQIQPCLLRGVTFLLASVLFCCCGLPRSMGLWGMARASLGWLKSRNFSTTTTALDVDSVAENEKLQQCLLPSLAGCRPGDCHSLCSRLLLCLAGHMMVLHTCTGSGGGGSHKARNFCKWQAAPAGSRCTARQAQETLASV
jgi:hypothetical protein